MDLPKGKQTPQARYLTARETYDLLMKEHSHTLFIDVRTQAEVAFLGYPTFVDANIPYEIIADWRQWDEKGKFFKMTVNQNFVKDFEERLHAKGLNNKSAVIVMCRSGFRSAAAAKLLATAGYNNVYNLVDGFEGDVAQSGPQLGLRVVNGWVNSQLPCTFALDKAKMYL